MRIQFVLSGLMWITVVVTLTLLPILIFKAHSEPYDPSFLRQAYPSRALSGQAEVCISTGRSVTVFYPTNGLATLGASKDNASCTGSTLTQLARPTQRQSSVR